MRKLTDECWRCGKTYKQVREESLECVQGWLAPPSKHEWEPASLPTEK